MTGLPLARAEIAEIVQGVCDRFGVTPVEVRSRSRANRVVEPRYRAMYLLNQVHGLSHKQVAVALRRDRSTVATALLRCVERGWTW